MRDSAGQQSQRLKFSGAHEFGLELRLALQLLANLLGLRADAAPERGDPGDKEEDAHGQRGREGENALARQPGGSHQHGHIAGVAQLKLKSHRLPVFVVFQFINPGE